MKKLKTQFAALALSLSLLSVLLLISARPAEAQTEAVFYSFTGGNDGGNPDGGVVSDGAGNFLWHDQLRWSSWSWDGI